MLKHYVEFLYPGILFGESSIREVDNRNPYSVTIPDEAYGFRFLDKEEIAIDDEILKGKNKNVSGWYYQGRKMSIEDVKREMPNKNILIDNMISNRYGFIVFTKFGQAFPLEDNDTVL